jgi:hypothetical protein
MIRYVVWQVVKENEIKLDHNPWGYMPVFKSKKEATEFANSFTYKSKILKIELGKEIYKL